MFKTFKKNFFICFWFYFPTILAIFSHFFFKFCIRISQLFTKRQQFFSHLKLFCTQFAHVVFICQTISLFTRFCFNNKITHYFFSFPYLVIFPNNNNILFYFYCGKKVLEDYIELPQFKPQNTMQKFL